jgi:hypothetical protein
MGSGPLTVVKSEPLPQSASGALTVVKSEPATTEASTAPPTSGSLKERMRAAGIPDGPMAMHSTAREALPSVLGALGGFLAGPPGAAIGGAVGEAERQMQRRSAGESAPATPIEAAQDIGGSGAVQGVVDYAGGKVVKGAQVVGKAMMENAVRPTMALLREFPDVVGTIIKERLPVGSGPLTAKGSEIAAEKLADASQGVRALLERATTAGKTFEASRMAKPVLDLIDEISKQPLGNSQMKQLDGMLTEFLERHKGPITPVQVQELKRAAQAIAKPVYKAVQRGEAVTAREALGARFNSAIAAGAKEAMETVPGVAAGEAHKQALIGAKRALTQAEGRRLSLMAEGIAGAAPIVSSLIGPDGPLDEKLKQAVGSYLIVRGIMSPRTMSRGALVLTAKHTQELLRQFPRLAAEVVRTAQANGDPAATALAPQ